jgi:hypothetical protein
LHLTDERKKWLIDLYLNQHKFYAEIAEIEKMSPHDINIIIKEKPDHKNINIRNSKKRYLPKPTSYF